jgi:hypothetical protein
VHESPLAVVNAKPEPPPIPLAEDVLLVPADHGPARVRSVPAERPETDDLAVSPEDPTVKIETRICLNCSHTVNKHDPVCAYCKFDARKGLPKKLAGVVEEVATCRECGYELTGLTKPICPECGAKVSLTRRGSSFESQSREVRRWAYLKPLIMLGIGMGGVLLHDLIRHPGWEWPLFRLLDLAVTIPAVAMVYIACAFAWIGFDMPLHLVTLRIAGAYAVASLVYWALAWTQIPIIPMGFAAIAYVWMLHEDLDMELQDAVIVTVLSFGMRAILYVTLAAKIASMLGI